MPPILHVRAAREYDFDKPFLIGRVEECDVCIKDEYVSRNHARVAFENGQWWVRDLKSANGIYVGDKQVDAVPIERALKIRLGIQGPFVSFETKAPVTVDDVAQHYFGGSGPAGEHTMIVRQAFQRVQKKQRSKYGRIIAAMAAVVIVVGAFAAYQFLQVRHQKALAQDLFYNIKSLDLEIANVEKQHGMDAMRQGRERRKAMEKSYDRFLSTLHVYDRKMTPEQRLILRIARIFGECELDMPPGFAGEIHNYIQKWRSSGRLRQDIFIAKEKGYARQISQELLAQGLPAQFFYLALQESDFDPYISGPMTRSGIAKGMWQFIPDTAVKYGLRIGPLADFRRPDTGDDRHHYDLETKAAARYLKDLYSTDAQASGLLVMACYNWGERSVLPLVRSMPQNPRERNFWQLLSKYRDKIPQETYDYVFYIASAAVIGEDPRLFGFDFEDPLAHLESK